jgi:hypothetical protein
MVGTYADTLAALSGDYSKIDAANDAMSAHAALGGELDPEVLTGLTFIDALFSGKRYIRVPYNQLQGRDGYAVFDTQIAPIADLCGLHDHEFIKEQWEACDLEEFDAVA